MVVRIAGGPSTAQRRVTSKPLSISRASYSTPRRVTQKPYQPSNVPVPTQRVAPSGRQSYAPPAPAPMPRPSGGFNMPGAYAAPAAPVYQPAQIQAYAPVQQAPSNFSQNFAPGGGDFGGQSFAPPPPRPARKVYDKDSWLAGDADYKEQTTEYDRALGSFRNRINAKKEQFNQDYNQSKGVTEKNQQFTLNDLGEDFGARGLSYSGLFDQTKERTNDQFRNQLANLLQMRTRNTNQADEEFGDFKTETNLRKANALRQAIARMSQQQALSDMELGY